MLGFNALGRFAVGQSVPVSIVVAALTVTEQPDTLASTGILPVIATAAITEGDDTLSSSAVIPIVAAASVLEADDTLDALVELEILAALGGLEDDDSLVSAAFQSAPLRIGVSASSKVGISCAIGSASMINARAMQRPSLSARVT